MGINDFWDPFTRPSYYSQQDKNQNVPGQLLGMTLASHLQEQGESMIHHSLRAHLAGLRNRQYRGQWGWRVLKGWHLLD